MKESQRIRNKRKNDVARRLFYLFLFGGIASLILLVMYRLAISPQYPPNLSLGYMPTEEATRYVVIALVGGIFLGAGASFLLWFTNENDKLWREERKAYLRELVNEELEKKAKKEIKKK